MNLLGKITVVLILIASLVFMTLAMVVFATHKNWYLAVTAPGGLQEQLTEQRAENTRLTERYNRLQTQLEGERDSLSRQLAKAETEWDRLQQENTNIDEQLTTLRTNLRTATAAVSATQEQNQRLNEQRDQLLASIRDAQAKRDELFQIAKDATLELQQRLGDLTQLRERLSQLLPQVAQYRGLLSSMNINPDQPPDFVPNVDGVVDVVRLEGAQRLIEVSIGSDDGLQRGLELIITRDGRYIGKARVVRTWPDGAVCEIVPGFVTGNIQEGDRVATRV